MTIGNTGSVIQTVPELDVIVGATVFSQGPDVERTIAGFSGFTPFHRHCWLQAVQEVYGHKPICVSAKDGEGNLVGWLPLCEVSGPFTGKALVSIPYSVYGGAVAYDIATKKLLLRRARRLAVEQSCRYVEIREEQAETGYSATQHYYTFRRELPSVPKEILGEFPRKARAAVRNGINKHGLHVQYGPRLLDVFYQLYVLSLRRLASPAHSRRFLERLLEEYGDDMLVQVTYHEQEPAMGVISFVDDTAIYPYWAGIDDRYNRMNVSNVAYYELMKWAVENGRRRFDFGRTRKDNEGGCSFKANQGFKPTELVYQYHSPAGKPVPDLRPSNRRFALAQKVWRKLPLYVAARGGAIVTRWIP